MSGDNVVRLSKKLAYELGEWDAPKPTVSTLRWTAADWIEWIDQNHGWLVPVREG